MPAFAMRHEGGPGHAAVLDYDEPVLVAVTECKEADGAQVLAVKCADQLHLDSRSGSLHSVTANPMCSFQ